MPKTIFNVPTYVCANCQSCTDQDPRPNICKVCGCPDWGIEHGRTTITIIGIEEVDELLELENGEAIMPNLLEKMQLFENDEALKSGRDARKIVGNPASEEAKQKLRDKIEADIKKWSVLAE